MKDYVILYLEPYVYVSIVNDSFIIYNTLDGSNIIKENDRYLAKYIRILYEEKNLNVIILSKKEFNNQKMKEFIYELRKKFCGDFYYSDLVNGKPIQPIAYLKNELPENNEIPVNPLDHLKEVNLYINNTVAKSIKNKKISNQMLWDLKENEYKEICMTKILNLVNETKNTDIRINILGGNVFKHSKFYEIVELMYNNDISLSLYIHYTFLSSISFDEVISKFKKVYILVDFFSEEYDIEEMKKILNVSKFEKLIFKFAVSKEEDFLKIEEIMNSLNIKNYDISPFYNGSNMEFFERHVFIDKKDLHNVKLSMRDIYSKLNVNLHNYGKLSIKPDGSVYTDLNNKMVANLNSKSLLEIACDVIISEGHWKINRESVKPCKDCIYKILCPPISNYEQLLNKFDMCN